MNDVIELGGEAAIGEDLLRIEELEERSSMEFHGACACTCSCNCSSCSCVVWW